MRDTPFAIRPHDTSWHRDAVQCLLVAPSLLLSLLVSLHMSPAILPCVVLCYCVSVRLDPAQLSFSMTSLCQVLFLSQT